MTRMQASRLKLENVECFERDVRL
ncbi:MAG: hypothetical protein QOD74_2640, partial [Variibacter sp.]|nr:hypothetical protein [Variibacter sp.]